MVNNPKFVKDLKTVKDLVPMSTILQQEKTKLETLDALTGSKFVKEFLKLKVQRSDVMVIIMSFLEPNCFLIFEKLSKKFYHEHFPRVIEEWRRFGVSSIMDKNQKNIISGRIGFGLRLDLIYKGSLH